MDETGLSSAGNMYYAPGIYGPNHFIYGFDKNGAPLGGNFPIDPTLNPGPQPGRPTDLAGDICGTAVDSAGNLWVANYGLGRLLEYSSAGVFLKSIDTLSLQNLNPCSIAFDSNDDLYAAPVWKFTAASGYTTAMEFVQEGGAAVAVDPVTHHVFISNNQDITEYNQDGDVMAFAAKEIPGASPGIPKAVFRGLAFDPEHDRLYASDQGNGKVRVFGAPLTYPDLTLGTASGVEETAAILAGTISAQGVPLTDCHFEYVNAYASPNFDDLSSGGNAPCSPAAGSIPPDSATHPVTAALSGLSPNTPYRFRLVAANANGSIYSASTGSFETVGPPLVETTGSPVRGTTTARLDARVDPAGKPATYHFEYGDQGPCDANPCTSTEVHSISGVDEVQRVTVNAISGQFKLTFGAETTADIPFDASAMQVEAALVALASIAPGDVALSGGPGNTTGSQPYIVRFTGPLSGKDVPQLAASEGTTPLSGESSATATTTTPGAPSAKEVQSIAIKAAGGQFQLTFGAETTIGLPFNASAGEVGPALQALPSIGAGNVAVTGGPGDANGSNPYVVTFQGTLANKNVAQLEVANGTVPLSGAKGAMTATTTSGGPLSEFTLVSQQIEGLQASTTYHYRVIADNGSPNGPVAGGDMTVTTFASEAPLSHGHLAGPPGSDRAWEMVSAPDTGGNPVGGFAKEKFSIADAGDRAVYGLAGGTPDSETGTINTMLFAERTPSGWRTKAIVPSREEANESEWVIPRGPRDLSEMFSLNRPFSTAGKFTIWRLTPGGPPEQLQGGSESPSEAVLEATSENATPTVMASLDGTWDPDYPVEPSYLSLYDIGSGSPRLIGLLPDGTVPPCGARALLGARDRAAHAVSPDGSLAFFGIQTGSICSVAPVRIYVRDIDAETTTLISGSPISGRECGANFIKSTPGAAFFYTQSRLVAEDTEPTGCDERDGADIYRSDLSDGSLDCVTCVVPGVEAGVMGSSSTAVGVAEDGSRVYFRSSARLLPGAAASGGIYRVNVKSGDLAYVGFTGGFIGSRVSANLSSDGSVAVFESSSQSMNALGGQQNAGTRQYYRYDDRDRSLVCVSCPADGSGPRGEVPPNLAGDGPGANVGFLDAAGDVFAFATPTALVPADQNTAGAGQRAEAGRDVYEWRNGRLLLVSDGLTDWPGYPPDVIGVTPSGHDIFFLEAAQLTQDALDGYTRLYDARIGGGFEFPRPPKPCPLEVCQGTPKGAPEEAAPGTATIAGAGNASRAGRIACAKPKRKVRQGGKTRCVKPARHKHGRQGKTNNNRGAAR